MKGAKKSAKLYFAYGANTNVESMSHRCPQAVSLATCSIPDHALVFRGVADVIERQGAKVRGVMWAITKDCERALDSFEGYPRLYVKKYVTVRWQGKDQPLMLYVMRHAGEKSPPWTGYEECLREGYRTFGISTRQIDTAIADAARERSRREPRQQGGFRKLVPAYGSQWFRREEERHDTEPSYDPFGDDPTDEEFGQLQHWSSIKRGVK